MESFKCRPWETGRLCSMFRIVNHSRSRVCIGKRSCQVQLSFCSPISTNSAIHRGIRRSRRERGSFRNGSRDSDDRTNGSPRTIFRKSTRVRKPNHLHRQDVEDMAESARLKAEKRSPRSKHLALSFEAAQNALQRSHESKRLEGHISIPSNIYQNKSSPNRAARQTALFSNARSSTSGQSYKNALSSRRQAGEFSAVEKTDQEYSRQRTGHHHLRGYGSRRQEDFGLKSNLNDKGEQYQALSITLTGQASNAQPLSCNYPGRKPAADVPDTVPYTTPASEFLYGTSVVIAALKFSGRKFYKLYSYVSLDRANRGQDEAIRSLARSQGVEVKQVEGAWLRILDKMSSGRPHNVLK